MTATDPATVATPWSRVPAGRPVRAVVVGAGGMGTTWARQLVQDQRDGTAAVELVGWVDLDVERLRAAAADLGVGRATLGRGVGEVVRATGADLVVDVTVPEAHRAVTEEALELGCAVLGEKPMAASMPDALAMVATADRTGALYVVSQTRRHHPQLHRLRERLPELGRVGMLDAGFYLAPRFGGFRDRMAHPLLLDMSIHAMDAARFLHPSPPVAVLCDAFNPPWSWYDGKACATAVFELADGARFTYRASWCAPGHDTSWNAEWRVVGEHGSARWDGEEDVDVRSAAGPRRAADGSSTGSSPGRSSVAGVLDEVLDALRTGSTPSNECHENLSTLAMVHAAVLAGERGRRVLIEEVLVP